MYALVLGNPHKLVRKHKGWPWIIYGFALIFFGMVIDITDNFPQLNSLIIVGDTPWQAFLEKFIGYLIGFALLALGFWKWIPSIEEVEKSKIELEEALLQVKTLKGIVPICAYCKKIRTDEGYWKQVEDILAKYTGAQLSHGVCPECLDREIQEIL